MNTLYACFRQTFIYYLVCLIAYVRFGDHKRTSNNRVNLFNNTTDSCAHPAVRASQHMPPPLDATIKWNLFAKIKRHQIRNMQWQLRVFRKHVLCMPIFDLGAACGWFSCIYLHMWDMRHNVVARIKENTNSNACVSSSVPISNDRLAFLPWY